MFFSLVLSLCAGASAPVGAPCDEWVISQHQSAKQCMQAMDKKISQSNGLFQSDDIIISCEKIYIAKGK